MGNQSLIDNTKGYWEEIEGKGDKEFYKIGVGETLIVTYVSNEANKNFPKEIDHTLELENGDLIKIHGTTDLNEKFEDVESGDKLKITRFEDTPLPPPKRPKQNYRIERWVKKC